MTRMPFNVWVRRICTRCHVPSILKGARTKPAFVCAKCL